MVIKEILNVLGGGLFKEVKELVDDVVTTKEEKLEIAAKIKQAEMEFAQKADELDLQYQKEITARHKNDMASDSWLSKNIRPLTLASLVGMLLLLLGAEMIYDYNINDSLTNILMTWGTSAFLFYFGSRGWEKVTEIKTKNKGN